jgi:Do/DeqQ family serine protease
MPRIALALAFVFVATVAGLVGLVAGGGGVVHTVAPALAPISLPSFQPVVERANLAVVHIAVAEGGTDLQSELGQLPGFGNPRRGEGSGFIYDPSGLIVTNDHVVAGATRVRVRLADKHDLPARIVGTDPQTDLAVLKIDAPDLVAIPLASDSYQVKVGDWVCAIGNPYGFDHSVTVGIISSTKRKIWDASFDSFIQTDAAINPGNSGGPLLNTSGEVIGINSAMIAQGQGIGFAVPVNVARPVIHQLETSGRVSRGYLGIQLQEMEPDLQKLIGAADTNGAVVLDVVKGAAGEAAGLRRYDVITDVGGKLVHDGDDLVHMISSHPPGSAVTLTVFRDGHRVTLEARLDERATSPHASTEAPTRPASHDSAADPLGLDVVDLSDTMRHEMAVPATHTGVVVKEVQGTSPGAESLSHGDVIVEINRKPTPNRRAYNRVVASLQAHEVAWLFVYRPRPAGSFLARLDVE